MATYYCDIKTGSDTTGAGTVGNPYKTPQKCHDVATTNDTIYIQSGFYEATVNVTKSNLTFEGIGFVVFQYKSANGNTYGFILPSTYNITFKNIYFKGFTIPFSQTLWAGGTITVTMINVKIAGSVNLNMRGYLVLTSTYITGSLNINGSNIDTLWLTFDKCKITSVNPTFYGYPRLNIKNSIIGSITDASSITTAIITTLDYNCITGSIKLNNVTYANLAAFQAAFPALAPNSFSNDPLNNADGTLQTTSPCIGMGEGGINLGPLNVANYYTLTDVFANGVANNVGIVGSFVKCLDASVQGSWASEVFNSAVAFTNLRLAANFTDNEYIVDKYYRWSATTFLKTDVSPSWTLFTNYADVAQSAGYLQVKFVLKNRL